jgi:hypothetical protein
MWWHVACEALNAKKCLEIRYDGFSRIVEVHAVGTTDDGNPVMRVWQVSGGSASGERTGFKLMRLDKTWGLGVSNEVSQAPRRGYKRGDKAISIIRCQV